MTIFYWLKLLPAISADITPLTAGKKRGSKLPWQFRKWTIAGRSRLRVSARLLGTATVLALISACGQKGPLYLPPRNGTVITRPAGSTAPPPQSTPSQAPAPQTDQSSSPQTTGPGQTDKKTEKDNPSSPH